MRLIISLIAFFAFLIFAIQNIMAVNVRFFTFQIEQVPLFSVMVTIFIFGALFGYGLAWVKFLFLPKKSQKTSKD